MIEHDARTLPAAACAMIACAWAATTGNWWTAAALVAACAGASVLIARGLVRADGARRAHRIAAGAALSLSIAATVVTLGAWRAELALPSEVDAALDRGGEITVRGVVVGEAREVGRDVWTGAQRRAVRIRVDEACAHPCAGAGAAHAYADLVVAPAHVPPLGRGVEASGRATAARDARVAVTLWDAAWTATGADDGWLLAIGQARDRTRAQAASAHPQVRALVVGMVLGDTRDMPPHLTEAMRVTSLTHLTAVSGSHFAMVTLALGVILRRWVRWRWCRAVVLASLMALLATMVGPEPSVLRALTMALAVAAGIAWGRPSRALPALGVGVLALLVIEPALGASTGLHLSALAVVAIVVWAPRIAQLVRRWMVDGAATALSVPLAAWLACWPLLTTLNQGLGPYAVPANLVASVAAFPVTLIGLAGAVVGQWWAAGGAALLTGASWCAWPVVWAAQVFAGAPGAWLAWPHGATGTLIAAAVVALLAWGTMAHGARGALRVGAAAIAVVVSLASPMLTAQLASFPANAAVVVCDVGQGDMTLVMADQARAVVIDTGPPGGAGAACLRRHGVREVPLLVLTHPHADHDGAVGEIAGVARIDQVWVSPAGLAHGHDAAVQRARELGLAVTSPAAGATFADGAARVELLLGAGALPSHRIISGAAGAVNDASLVLWVDSGGASALMLGDLEDGGQAALKRRLNGPVVVDLVKVAHHGSRVQSDALAGFLTARVAAISVGADNSYGHPHPGTVALYASRATLVLTTARCGDIVLTVSHHVAAQCPSSMAG